MHKIIYLIKFSASTTPNKLLFWQIQQFHQRRIPLTYNTIVQCVMDYFLEIERIYEINCLIEGL